MRIGMILDNHFPPDVRVENEAVSLIKSGHEVFLYCFKNERNQPHVETINNINVRRYQVKKTTLKFSALAYTFPVYHILILKSLKHFIQHNNIQVLHIHDLTVARAVFWISKRLRLPLVLDLHENRPEIMKYYTHVRSFPGRFLIYPGIWKKHEAKYIRKADKVVVVTKEAKGHYVNNLKLKEEKFYVVPNTVRKAFYEDYNEYSEIIRSYQDFFTLLYLGETGHRRGIETMILALKHIIPVVSKIKLVIVGRSKADNHYRELVSKAGYEKYVDLEGWQDMDKFPSYILASDVGTCPIHKNLHHDTTYANKIFQYMAFGKPLIVSDCDAQANIVKEYNCGLIFEDRDEKAFADSVIKLYNDRTKREKMGTNARKAITERLNWDEMSRELIKLYAEYESKGI